MVTQYVCGFLFSHDRNMVALIEKKRPDWQVGCLNGIGGKIDSGESPFLAMVREFKEETGVRVGGWKKFALLNHTERDGIVHFFKADVAANETLSLQQTTDERVLWVPAHYLAGMRVIPNLRWLIPMAMDDVVQYANVSDTSRLLLDQLE